MVKRGTRPSWHLAFTAALLLAAAAGVFHLHWRSRPDSDTPANSAPVPTRPAAFADSLAAGMEGALADVGIRIAQVITLVDRSGGVAAHKVGTAGIPYVALVTPSDLGVTE